MTPLRGVLVGAGYFAQFHAEAWSRVEGAGIAAVADTDLERARVFARQWGIRGVYANLDAAIASESPDFVDIATRPESHVELAARAASTGVHVICQKPMAPSMSECRGMVETARSAGTRLVIHENWRWQPWYREARRVVESGRLGRVFHVGFRIRTGDGRGPEPYVHQPYFREMPRLLIYETLVHFLDTCRYLAGEAEWVHCSTQRVNPVIRGEDAAVIHIGFRSGARGVIDANRIAGPLPPPVAFGEMRVEGDRAAVSISGDGDLRLIEYDAGERAHEFEKPSIGYKGDSVRAMQQHFVDCLRSGATAESEGEDYLKTVTLVEACYRSAAKGAVEVVV